MRQHRTHRNQSTHGANHVKNVHARRCEHIISSSFKLQELKDGKNQVVFDHVAMHEMVVGLEACFDVLQSSWKSQSGLRNEQDIP